jgi:hypothetical protein
LTKKNVNQKKTEMPRNKGLSMKKPKILSKQDIKDFLSDMEILRNKLENPNFRESIENLLQMVSDGTLNFFTFETYLSRTGLKVYRPIRYILECNDLSVIDELKEAGAPREVLDFFEKITVKFGFLFQNYKKTLYYPNDFTRFDHKHFYNFDRDEPCMIVTLQKRNGDIIKTEGAIDSFLWLVERILLSSIETCTEAKKNMPKIKAPFHKGRIDRISKAVLKLQKIFATKRAH